MSIYGSASTPRACRIRSSGSGSRAIAATPRTTGSTRSPARPSPRSERLSGSRSLRRTLGRHGLFLARRLFKHDIEHLLRAVAGIVAFDQPPDVRLARTAEVQSATYFARHPLLHLGNPERDFASYLHMARRDAFDDSVDRHPIALGARRDRVELALYRPQAVVLGRHDIARLGALDL